jgi:hypothetical protein
MPPWTSSGLTLAELFARIPPGDDRLAALAAWRRAQDRLKVVTKPPPVKLTRNEPEPPKITEHVETAPHVAADEARREWEQRRDDAQAAKVADEASALRARVTHAVELTCARVNALPDPVARRAKMVKLGEIQASLMGKDPKTLSLISGKLAEIETRLARLTAE